MPQRREADTGDGLASRKLLMEPEGGGAALVCKAVPGQRAGLGNKDHSLTVQPRRHRPFSFVI